MDITCPKNSAPRDSKLCMLFPKVESHESSFIALLLLSYRLSLDLDSHVTHAFRAKVDDIYRLKTHLRPE